MCSRRGFCRGRKYCLGGWEWGRCISTLMLSVVDGVESVLMKRIHKAMSCLIFCFSTRFSHQAACDRERHSYRFFAVCYYRRDISKATFLPRFEQIVHDPADFWAPGNQTNDRANAEMIWDFACTSCFKKNKTPNRGSLKKKKNQRSSRLLKIQCLHTLRTNFPSPHSPYHTTPDRYKQNPHFLTDLTRMFATIKGSSETAFPTLSIHAFIHSMHVSAMSSKRQKKKREGGKMIHRKQKHDG